MKKRFLLAYLIFSLFSTICFANVNNIKNDYDIINNNYLEIMILTNSNMYQSDLQKLIYKLYLQDVSNNIELSKTLVKTEEAKKLCDSLQDLIYSYLNNENTDQLRTMCADNFKLLVNKDGEVDKLFDLVANDYKK